MNQAVVVIALVLTGVALAQDEFTQRLDRARQAYDRHDYRQATDHLKAALELLNGALVSELESFLPSSFGPWQAGEAFSSIGHEGYSAALSARRHYVRSNSGEAVDVEIYVEPPSLAIFKRWLANPLLLSSEGRGQVITVRGQRCIEKYDAMHQSAELHFVCGSATLVSIKGYEIKSTDLLKQFAERIDFAQLQRYFP